MSSKVKGKEFPTVRVSEKLMKETVKCAEIVGENKSEYIRKAVEARNKDVLKAVEKEKKKVRKEANDGI